MLKKRLFQSAEHLIAVFKKLIEGEKIVPCAYLTKNQL